MKSWQCDINEEARQFGKGMPRDGGNLSVHKVFAIGDIHGVRTGDDLVLHFFRHVAIRRPELYVVENVRA